MREILVVGSVAYDSISTPTGKVENTLGGSANYFSIAASFYTKVNVVGVVGSDYKSEDIEMLKSRGVCTAGLQTVAGETFRWSGEYTGDMNEATTLATHLNVFKDFQPVLPEAYKSSPILFLANIDPILQLEVLKQAKSPSVIGLDTMNYWIGSKIEDVKTVLKKVDILTVNEKEAEALAGERNIVKAAKKLGAMGPKAVIIKRGEYGFVLFAEDRLFVAPAFPVENVVDPTGAGDSFAGGFFGFLSRLKSKPTFRDLQEACIHGTVVASFAVEDFGIKQLLTVDSTKVERRLSHYLRVFSLND